MKKKRKKDKGRQNKIKILNTIRQLCKVLEHTYNGDVRRKSGRRKTFKSVMEDFPKVTLANKSHIQKARKPSKINVFP